MTDLRAQRLARFRERRLGCSSTGACTRWRPGNEWMRHRERTPDADVPALLRALRSLTCTTRGSGPGWPRQRGCATAVITTKHHEGFCLWDSDLTDFKATNTPSGRDLIGPFVDGVARTRPGRRLLPLADRLASPATSRSTVCTRCATTRRRGRRRAADIAVYRRYLHGQVRELLTRYGPIDDMWFDFSYVDHVHEGKVWGGKGADDWDSAGAAGDGPRAAAGHPGQRPLGLPGDFVTPEQYQPSEPMTRDGQPVLWEACQTLNGSWGYDRDNRDYKSRRPAAADARRHGRQGRQPAAQRRARPRAASSTQRAVETLRGIGEWMRLHARSIYGAGPSDVHPAARLPLHRSAATGSTCTCSPGRSARCTCRAWPAGSRYAQFLHDASEIGREIADPGAGTRRTPRRAASRRARSRCCCRSSRRTSRSR